MAGGNKLSSGAVLVVAGICLLPFAGCAGGMQITPQYATVNPRTVNGEIAFASVVYPRPTFGDPYSLGAVKLATRIDYFFQESLKQELAQYGFAIQPQARLELQAEVASAETVWRKQGAGGVFTTTITIKFIVRDRERKNDVVYQSVHEGSVSHAQSYGGYPASASLVDALGKVYTNFLRDPVFQQLLVETRSVNLSGEQYTRDAGKTKYADTIFKSYPEALAAMMPDVAKALEPFRARQNVIAVFGFRDASDKRTQFSKEIERELKMHLSNGRFLVVTREIEDVIKEQALQQSDLFDEAKRTRIGRLLNAQLILTGSAVHYLTENVIKLRIEVVETETGRVYAAFSTTLVATPEYIRLLQN